MFFKNTLTLIIGSVAGQAFPIILSPVLTRLYDPSEFGSFAIFFGIVSILVITATARYELAVLLPKKNKNAYGILYLTFISLVITCTIFHIVFFVIQECFTNFEISLKLIAPSILLMGSYQALYCWFNRQESYKNLAIAKFLQNFCMILFQISYVLLLPYSQSDGLVYGFIFGQLVSFLYLAIIIRAKYSVAISLSRLKRLALLYKNFPKFLIFSHTLNSLSRQLPIFSFSYLYGALFSGYYLLLQRVIGSPVSVVGSSIGDVFTQKASKNYALHGECHGIYLSTLRNLIFISAIPFVIFFFLAPMLFPLIFGEKWSDAGYYAQILTPMFFMQFVTSPLSNMFQISNKQKQDMNWNVALFLALSGSILLGFYLNDFSFMLHIFSVSYTIMYGLCGWMTYKYSRGSRKVLI